MTNDQQVREVAVTDVREGLLLAGIAELEENGLQGFSLRRAAMACGVSCAAPYKHFKNKDDYVLAILRYINDKWHLLEKHITALPGKDAKELLIEVCLANVRFWIGNPHFRSVRLMDTRRLSAEQQCEMRHSEPSAAVFAAYVQQQHLDEKTAAARSFAMRTLLWGGILLAADERNDPFAYLREAFEREL